MRRAAAFALAALVGLLAVARGADAPRSDTNRARFTLTETRSQAVSGPFTLFNGARVRLGGTLYVLSLDGDGRVTFTAPGGATYGPFQPVAGRLMRIGDAMYAYNGGGSGARAASQSAGARPVGADLQSASASAAAPIATFEPMPPPPDRIEIPPETPQRTAPALDLPNLPEPSRAFLWHLWFAPIDNTPLKWKVEKVNGRETDFERTSFGAGLTLKSWFAEADYSTSGKSGSIVPSGLGFTGASIDDATGYSLSLGYKRPFLREGGWTASAGLLGRIRQDKGDISSSALVSTGEADTNELGNVISKYESRKSSVKITEKSLRLDFDLAYQYQDFHGFAGLRIQPLSSVSVSGTLPYGEDNLKISAKHDDAIGVVFGGTVDLKAGFYFSADLTLGYETRLRLALSRDW